MYIRHMYKLFLLVLFIILYLFYFSTYIFVLHVYILNAYLYYLLLSHERLVTVLLICMSRQCKSQANSHHPYMQTKNFLLITATHNTGDDDYTWCLVCTCEYQPPVAVCFLPSASYFSLLF